MKRKKPEDIADYLAKNEIKEEKVSVDVSSKDSVRKQQMHEQAHDEAVATAEKQSNYQKAVKKAKKESANAYAKPDDEYDEIEAAINRQKLLMLSGVPKKGEAAVHELVSNTANVSEGTNPAPPSTLTTTQNPNPTPTLTSGLPSNQPSTPSQTANSNTTPTPAGNANGKFSMSFAGLKDENVLITDAIHFINAVPSFQDIKQYRQR